MEQSRNAYRVLVGNPEGKIPLGRSRRRWEDNIKMDLREVSCDPGEWIDLAKHMSGDNKPPGFLKANCKQFPIETKSPWNHTSTL